MIATWKLASTKTRATLELDLFGKPSKRAMAEVVAEAEALLRFVQPELAKHEVVVTKS